MAEHPFSQELAEEVDAYLRKHLANEIRATYGFLSTLAKWGFTEDHVRHALTVEVTHSPCPFAAGLAAIRHHLIQTKKEGSA